MTAVVSSKYRFVFYWFHALHHHVILQVLDLEKHGLARYYMIVPSRRAVVASRLARKTLRREYCCSEAVVLIP